MLKNCRFITTVAALVAVCFAGNVQAETLYTGWGGSSAGILNAYDLETGGTLSTFGAPTGTPPSSNLGYSPQGVAVSPIDGNVYAAEYKYTSGVWDICIKSYNATTGAYISDVYNKSDSTYLARGIAFDSAGNLYAALGNKNIARRDAVTGTWDYAWGDVTTIAYAQGSYAYDLTVHDGFLYASVQGTGTGYTGQGRVIKYDLSGNTSVDPTLVTTDTNLTRVSGLAFGLSPDGTSTVMYTTVADTSTKDANSFGYWNAAFDTYTSLQTGLSRPLGIAYSDGYLYINEGKTSSTAGKLDRYELGDDNTWEQGWQTSGNGTYYNCGWVAVVVPEPSTFALLATGLIGLLAYAWRKRK